MLLLDSGWVPVASGTFSAVADCSRVSEAMITFAASGTNGAATATLLGLAGVDSSVPIPPPHLPNYSGIPLITASFSFSLPAANANTTVYFGTSASLAAWTPDRLAVTILAGSASYGRVIVEGHV